MSPRDDVADILGEELMKEMAGSFFGDRRRMQDRMDAVKEMVAELKRRARDVDDRARFLFRIATAPEKGRELLRRLGADPAPFPRETGLPVAALPGHVPSAFTRRAAYQKLLGIAYRGLEEAVSEYMRGRETPGGEDEGPTYRLLEAIVDLMNRDVERINRNRTPSHVLRTARQFRNGDPTQEAAAGAVEYREPGSGLDRSMAFSPLAFEELGLRPFPELPPLPDVRNAIHRFGGEIFERDRDAALSVLRAVREAIRTARKDRSP